MNRNADTIQQLLKPNEERVRLFISTPSGPSTLPSASGYLLVRHVPSYLIGKVRLDTFDKENRPLRRQIDAYLPGQGADSAQATEQTHSQTSPPIAQHIDVLLGKLKAQTAEADSRPLPPPPPPPSVLRSLPAPPPMPAVSLEPDLAREVALAQTQQLRSLTQQSETATESAIEQERLSLVKEAQYTRELAEWQQLGSVIRKELYGQAVRTMELSQRSVEQADFAAQRLLKTSDRVAKRLKHRAYQPPPPPKATVDYGSVAIAGLNMLSSFATALSPAAIRSSGSGPGSGSSGSGSSGSGPAAALSGIDEQPVSLTKERLIELAEMNVLGVFANSEALANLVRSDKLHTRFAGVEPPVNGIYSFKRSTLIQLAQDGILTLFGDSLKLVELLNNADKFEDLIRSHQAGTP